MSTPGEQNITFDLDNGATAHGYLVGPDGDRPDARGPGLLVIQEWWGLTPHIADITRRFADDGFVALAPDLYGGEVAHDPAEAKRMMSALPFADAVRTLAGAVDRLLVDDRVIGDRVGVVGFCMGGGFVLALAAQEGERVFAAVPFYGLPPEKVSYSDLTAAVLGMFASEDRAYPPAAVDAEWGRITDESDAEVDRIDWDAGHAFMNDAEPGRYDAEVAPRAWSTAVRFLREHAPTD
ncbi:dienelactone hydrolase family protein [Williamsia sterculiae]|uniref:Carboxymethylenebutenolidase n=1 Tax=Williamsia sterculiae TaxID=1344003 RepID=A0A1N7H575_9NOCA|nr:dienelactone hydrolase family protein [Williamsia sterculiae]SIS19962.1 carboxymethylenebutenolidase [Williamsia sterculiae]